MLDSGDVVSRTWAIDENPPQPELRPWMREPRISWTHPQDRIVFSFLVDDEHEQAAREWLAAL